MREYDPSDPTTWDDPNAPPTNTSQNTDPFGEQINALYMKYYGRPASAEEIASHRGNPGGATAVEAALKASNAYQQTNTTQGGNGGGGGTGARPLIPEPGPYHPGAYPDVPQFHPPTYHQAPAFGFEDYKAPDPFKGPTAADVLSDPSYTFRRDQGQQALEQSAAARGVLNGGGTLKDLLTYNQNLASTEYQNVWNRDLGAYGLNATTGLNAYNTRYKAAADTYATNLESQYNTPYKFAYQSAMDQFSPMMQDYQNRFSANQRNAEFGWNADYQRWLSDFERRFRTANA